MGGVSISFSCPFSYPTSPHKLQPKTDYYFFLHTGIGLQVLAASERKHMRYLDRSYLHAYVYLHSAADRAPKCIYFADPLVCFLACYALPYVNILCSLSRKTIVMTTCYFCRHSIMWPKNSIHTIHLFADSPLVSGNNNHSILDVSICFAIFSLCP